MADDFEDWDGPEFEPGWPDIFPLGLIVARSTATQRDHAEVEVGEDDEDEVQWVIHLGVADGAPRLAFIGDLTVSNASAFVGITVLLPFCLRSEGDLDPEERAGILRQYGRWASSIMYDHAAASARAMLAGNGLPIAIPYGTPEVELHLPSDDEEPSAEAAP